MKHACSSFLNLCLWLVLLVLSTVQADTDTEGSLHYPPAGLSPPELINDASEQFTDIDSANLDGLMQRIGDARLVLLGESTHGTAEFYDMRARITNELIKRKGFNIIAVEADWPDAMHINSFIHDGQGDAKISLNPFAGFPSWMWSNHSIETWLHWLRAFNRSVHSSRDSVKFYGLDLYNLFGAIQHVLDYTSAVDPPLARFARWSYGCLQPWKRDPFAYSRAIQSIRVRDCGHEVTAVLQRLRKHRTVNVQADGQEYFQALQSARLVRDGEHYYRNLNIGRNSWNQRDRSMFATLNAILNFHGSDAKAVVWAHNSHVGDARATQMAAHGDLNLGQLVREHFGMDAYLIGFGTDHGSVAAAAEWGGSMQVMPLPSATAGSYAQLFSAVAADNFLLPLREPILQQTRRRLLGKRLLRSIGVVYDPVTDRRRNYAPVSLPQQFDEYVWFRKTRAVSPLD